MLATTLSLLVIFIPVVFMGGRIGRFFSSFGATVAFAILMSMFVSFTMTPMLCSRFLKLKKDTRTQQRELRVAGRRRHLRLDPGLVAAASLGDRHHDGGPVSRHACSCSESSASTSSRATTRANSRWPSPCPKATRWSQADKLFAEIEGRLAGLSGVTNVFTSIGDTTGRVSRGQGDVTSGTIYARLTDLEERSRKWYDWRFWYQGIRGCRSRTRSTSRSSTCSGQPA